VGDPLAPFRRNGEQGGGGLTRPQLRSKWPGRETRNDRRNTRKPFLFPNHPQLYNGL